MTLIWLLALQDAPLRLSEDLEIRARTRAWYVVAEGGAKGDDDNPVIAFDDDLDLDPAGWSSGFAIGLYVPPEKDGTGRGASLVYETFRTSGEERLEGAEAFENSGFPAGSILRSRLRFQTFGIDAVLAGQDVPREDFAWSFSVGLHYLEAELRLSGAGAQESEEFADGNLKFGFGGEFRPFDEAFLGGRLAVYTDFISLLAGVDSGHYGLDLEVSAGLRLGPVQAEAGARLLAWTLNWPESEIDLVAYGPFLGLVLRF